MVKRTTGNERKWILGGKKMDTRWEIIRENGAVVRIKRNKTLMEREKKEKKDARKNGN